MTNSHNKVGEAHPQSADVVSHEMRKPLKGTDQWFAMGDEIDLSEFEPDGDGRSGRRGNRVMLAAIGVGLAAASLLAFFSYRVLHRPSRSLVPLAAIANGAAPAPPATATAPATAPAPTATAPTPTATTPPASAPTATATAPAPTVPAATAATDDAPPATASHHRHTKSTHTKHTSARRH
jgi:hypothetical protein